MKAMVLEKLCLLSENRAPLRSTDLRDPRPDEGEILLKVSACGVCHTELDEIEGRTPPLFFPMVLGHQIVGTVEEAGSRAKKFMRGDRVGIGWIYSACGTCQPCRTGQENLCQEFKATGRDAHGGYAEFTKVNEEFAYHIPGLFSDAEAAPLLCAGAIGYRSLRLAGLRERHVLGLTGFGASAHLVLKMVRYQYPTVEVFVFARSPREREFSLELGAVWAGDIEEKPPTRLDSIIDTTPVWKPVVKALEALRPGGRLVINAIRKEDQDKKQLMCIDYPRHLWLEKEIKSVANVARQDVREFIELAARIPLKPEIQQYSLQEANRAIMELKERRIKGAKVLICG
jgi:propanol-preferring alcohol dehydrogenase